MGSYSSENSLTVTNLASLADGQAKPIPAFTHSGVPPHDGKITVKITLNSTGVDSAGYINVYLLESTDGGSNFTDGISPAGSSDIKSSLRAAKLLGSLDANANNLVVWGVLDIRRQAGELVDDQALVINNESGAAFAASGHGLWWQTADYSS